MNIIKTLSDLCTIEKKASFSSDYPGEQFSDNVKGIRYVNNNNSNLKKHSHTLPKLSDTDESDIGYKFVTSELIKINKRLIDKCRLELSYAPEKQKKSQAYLNAIENLSDISSILDTYSKDDKYILTKDLGAIYSYLKKARKSLPNGKIQDLVKLLSVHVKAQWMKGEKQRLKARRIEKMKPFGIPGASKVKGCSFGVSSGIKSGVSIGTSLAISSSTVLCPDDEGLFFEEKNKGAGFSINGGGSARLAQDFGIDAELTGSVQLSQTKFKEYDNIESYVETEGHKIGKERFKLKSLIKTQQAAVNSQHELNKLLDDVLGLQIKVSPLAPKRVKPLAGYVNTTSCSARISSQVNLGIGIGLSASQQKSKSKIRQFVPTHISDVIQKDSSRIKEIPKNFIQHAHDLIHYSEGNEISKSAIVGLEYLKNDLIEYYDVVQKYDWLNSKRKNTPIGCFNLQKKKHQIEDRWGAIGRHQFLQFASASHAYLANIYLDSNTHQAQDVKHLISEISRLVKEPPISYSKSRYDKITSFQQLVYLEIDDKKTSFDINVGPVSLTVDILQRERLHPSRVRDGSYLDITVSGKISSSIQSVVDIQYIMSKLQEAAIQAGVPLPNDIEIIPDLGVDSTYSRLTRYFKPRYAKSNSFKGSKELVKQLTRDSVSLSINGDLGISNAMVPIGMNGAIDRTSTEVMKETIHANSLAYTMSRFNRFYRAANLTPRNEGWKKFVEQHKIEFQKLITNLGNQEHILYKEADFFFDELLERVSSKNEREEIKSFQKNFNITMKLYRNDPTERNFLNAFSLFEQYLEKLVAPWWESHTKTWQNLDFEPRKNSGLSFSSKIANTLGVHQRGNEKK